MQIKRILSGLGVLLLIGLLVLIGGAIYIVRTPLPKHHGELTAPGLSAPVEIVRDEWGVPHIYASTPQDLFFAQGYTQAQDRWWQMTFSRYLSQGRLGELVGRSVLAQDLQMRALGLVDVAQQEISLYDAETLSYLQAFADGVNGYTQSNRPGELALEYSVLSLAGMELAVEPWTPVDTLVYGKFVSLGLSSNYGLERMLGDLAAAIDPALVADFLPDFPYGEKPTVLRPEDVDAVIEPGGDTAVPPLFHDTSPDSRANWPTLGVGSNNWVVDGRYTASGAPLLANDPHLMIDLPSIWYELGLHCRPVSDACPFDVTGFTFSPFPGVALGHNQRIAWGATVSAPDVQDLYRLRVDPADPFRYEWDGGWREMETISATFAFADGAEPLALPMRRAHQGPVINDYAVGDSGEPGDLSPTPLALRWTALEPGIFFQAIFDLNRAANWDDFRAALRNWDFGSMNIVYADVDGHIGYQMPGNVPIRQAGYDGVTPAPGWTSDSEWQGYIPYDLLPRLFDPERGIIVTANQHIAPPEYWAALAQQLGDGRHYNFHTRHFIYGYRAQRIEELLLAGAPHTIESFQTIQADTLLISALEMQPYLANLALADAEVAAARDWLLDWDGRLQRDSGPAALYGLFWQQLLDNLYNDDLTANGLGPAATVHMWPTTRLLAQPNNPWWDDVRTPDVVETRDEILARTLTEVVETAVSRWGTDRSQWQWGDLHTATFVNLPLGQSGIGLVERLVNRGPLPVDGGSNVVNATSWNEQNADYFATVVLPSMRMIIDLGNLENSVSMNSTGQSGHLASPHYDDMIAPWQDVRYKPMHAEGEQTLVLRP